VESTQSKEKLLALGVQPEKIDVTGHTKVDQAFLSAPSQEMEEIKVLMPWLRQRQVLLAASTHEGEEKILCNIFKKINKENPDLILMLVPRHPERFEKVARLIKTQQLNFIRFSQINGSDPMTRPEVILIDRLGILKFLYPLAQIAFIGGSLVPVGGHNVWEAAAQGIPILYGPFMKNDYGLPQAGGALQVEDEGELEASVKDLLGSSEKKALIMRAMSDFIKGHRGASEKNLRLVHKLFPGSEHDAD
jgi:3-deoxy-D-manno-octulosonic-acid transferase